MTSHAVTTTVGGTYSRYVADWADSISAQTVQPDQVVIVDNRSDDPDTVRKAANRLGAELVVLDRQVNWGRARNIAIARTSTVWVQHFDVDDTMYPHALEETFQVIADQPETDVVQWGWDKDWGTRPHQRLYRPYDGTEILNVGPKAAGVSPFRRALWEQAPYDDLLEGAWDTGLWLGFAHLGARFRPTSQPCFRYRQHRDSILNSRLRQPQLKARVSGRLGHCYQPLDRAVVVMPWRDSGDLDRRRTMEWCTARWESYGLPVVHAPDDDPSGPWNLSQARNNGVDVANGRVLVIADADVMVDRDVIWQAIALAHVEPWVVPHGFVHRLTREATDAVLASTHDEPLPEPGDTIRAPYLGYEGGGLIVITPAQYLAAGRYDEEFRGWGAEDEAFALAARGLIGPPVRLDGPLTHLYHPPGLRVRDPHHLANRERLAVYRRAASAGRLGELRGIPVRTAPETARRHPTTERLGGPEMMIVHNGRRYRPEDAKRLGIPVPEEPTRKKTSKKTSAAKTTTRRAKNKARDVETEATGAEL